ncbi:MAG: heme NO-binding domain-containing protein [Gaiellales bacterium]
MVGLAHRILFDLIQTSAGADAVAEVKRRAGVPEDRYYRLDQAYDDAEWRRLFAATCEVLGTTPEQAEETYADFLCRDALRRWPMWFQMSGDAREFLERQPAIHNSFATGVQSPAERDRVNDKFSLEKLDDGFVMHYRSPNQLCGLYRATARWILRHYEDEAEIDETACQKHGDPECEIRVRWIAPQAR